jgi:hypothetical protein
MDRQATACEGFAQLAKTEESELKQLSDWQVLSNVKRPMSNVELVLSNDPITKLPNWVSG